MLNRRLLMAQAGATPPEDWDIDWDYTMGLPENNGFTLSKNGVTSAGLTENGIRLTARKNYGDIKYRHPRISPTAKFTIEVEAVFERWPGRTYGGFLIMGSIPKQYAVSISDEYARYRKERPGIPNNWNNSTPFTDRLTVNEPYAIRMEYSPEKQTSVIVNGKSYAITLSASEQSGFVICLAQNFDASVILRSIRYRGDNA